MCEREREGSRESESEREKEKCDPAVPGRACTVTSSMQTRVRASARKQKLQESTQSARQTRTHSPPPSKR